MIEHDVKQAVRLLEMSLSGLMSAETALKRWKGQIPPKVSDKERERDRERLYTHFLLMDRSLSLVVSEVGTV